MTYFSELPKTKFLNQTIVNLAVGVKLHKLIQNDAFALLNYAVKDGESPDTVAFNYYDDPSYAWLVLLSNNIIDPYFEWPLSQRNFESFLRQKYGSISVAQSTVERYERRLYEESQHNDGLGNIITVPARFVTVDKSTFDSLLPAERRIIYKYDHEENKNEAKRKIKILDEDFVPELVSQYNNYFQD